MTCSNVHSWRMNMRVSALQIEYCWASWMAYFPKSLLKATASQALQCMP